MSFEKPPPVPMNADNPVYFNLPDASASEARVAWDNDVIDVANSLATLDKLVEKQMSKPNRPKKRLSLKRLFSGGKVGVNGDGRKEEVKPKDGEIKDTERGEVCRTPSGEDENQNTEAIAKTTPSLGKRGLAKLKSLDLSAPGWNFLSGKESGERGVKTPTTPTPICPETGGAKSNSKPGTPILARGPKAKWYYNVEDSPSTPRRRAVSTEHLEKVATGSDADKSGSGKPPVAPSTRAGTRKTTSPSKVPPSGKRRTRSGSAHSRAGESPRPMLGLDAGPVQQLHATCRGFKASEQPDVVVLYAGVCETSVMWKDFFCRDKSTVLFGANNASLKISGQKLEDLYDSTLAWRGPNYAAEESVCHAQLQLVIVSPGLLQCVAAHSSRPVGRLLHATSVVGLMLGVAASDMTPGHLTGLQHFPQWTLVEVTSERTDKFLGQVYEESQTILDAKARENKGPSEPIFKLFPRKVNPGQPKLLIILDESVSNKTGISALFSIDDIRVVVEEHKWIADNIIQIEAPVELFSTSAMANVFLYLSGKNSGVRQLKVETHLKMIELAWQSATEPVTFFSQVFNVQFKTVSELDHYLSSQLDRRLDIGDLDLRTFPPSCVTEGLSDSEHPTLLHFAAHHGLVRLTERLMAGGCAKFLDTSNCHGLTVVELAERAGHTSLAATLKEIRGPQHEYDYPNMNVEQSNTPQGTDTSLDGYLIPNKSSDVAKYDTAFVFDSLKPTKPSLPPKTTLHPIQEKYPETDSKPVSPDAVSPDNLSQDKSAEDLYDVPKHHDVIYAVPPSPIPVAAKPATEFSIQSEISDDTLPLSDTPRKSEPGQKRKSRLNNYIPMNVVTNIQDENHEQFLPMIKTNNSYPPKNFAEFQASQDSNVNPFPLPKKASSFSEFSQPSQPEFIRSSTEVSGSSGSSRPGSGLSREEDFREGPHLSREELIGKYCRLPPDIPPRPDSTPPNFTRPAFSRIRANSGGSGRTRSDSECNVSTPKRCDSAGSATYKDFLKKLSDEKNKSCSTPAGTSPDTSQAELLVKSPAHVGANGCAFLPDVHGDDGKDDVRDIIQYFKDGKISANELQNMLSDWKGRQREAQIKTIRELLEEAGLDGVIKDEDAEKVGASKPGANPSTPGIVTKLFTKISPSTSKTGSIRVRKKSAPDIRNVNTGSTPEGGLKSLEGHYGSLINLSGRQSANRPTPPPEPARPLPPKTCQSFPPPAANLYDVPRKLSVGSSHKVDCQNNTSPARPVGRVTSLKNPQESRPSSSQNRSLPRVDRRDQSRDRSGSSLREDYVDHHPVSPKTSSSSHHKPLIPKSSEAVLLNANEKPRNNNIGAYENVKIIPIEKSNQTSEHM